MNTVLLTNKNLRQSLEKENSLFIIEEAITLDSDIVFPKDSVIEFRGGDFRVADSRASAIYIDFNGSNVSAPAYGIFPADAKVKGFSNSMIRAEWFNTAGRSESQAINEALVSANGCPVTLECKTYTIDSTIKFPSISGNPQQTLIIPGTIMVNCNVGIELDVSNVKLIINTLKNKSYGAWNAINYNHTAIEFSGLCQNVEIDALRILYFEKGISISPRSGYGTEFSKVQFQEIDAIYCIYVNLFGTGISDRQTTWFSETNFIGGRLKGKNGVFFQEPTGIPPSNTFGSNTLSFDKIGFEGLSEKPISLSYVYDSKFINLRMAEALPGLKDNPSNSPVDTMAKWIIMNEVSNIDISIKSSLSPNRFEAKANVRNVVAKAWFVDNNKAYTQPFDTLVFNPVPNGSGRTLSQMVATSSIQPYNMTQFLNPSTYPSAGNVYGLSQILPQITIDEPDNKIDIKVLPRVLMVEVPNMKTLTLDFTGLKTFGQCVFDVYADIKGGGSLNFILPNNGNASYYSSGVYRLSWDSDWRLFVTQIATS